eukprot:UN08416
MLKTSLLNHMQSSHTRGEELARNLQVFGEYKLPKLFNQIDDISARDVQKLFDKMLQDPVAVSIYGDAPRFPRKVQLR